jgi:hypothetical protein
VSNDAGATTIENLGAPVAATDAATKGYVDQVVLNVPNRDVVHVRPLRRRRDGRFHEHGRRHRDDPDQRRRRFPRWHTHLRPGRRIGRGRRVTIAPTLGVTLVNPYNSFALFGAAAEAKLTKIGTDAWSLNGEVV